ncbi:MAG: hypothetical protein ABIA63_11205 [bacterium]
MEILNNINASAISQAVQGSKPAIPPLEKSQEVAKKTIIDLAKTLPPKLPGLGLKVDLFDEK